ncbi:hypothetical protein EXIGLDRAFT_724921, partial [Exidia glandulosa HHB12029]
MVDTHTYTNTSSSPSALTATQHAPLDAGIFQVRSLLTGTVTRADSANDTADNHPDDDQLQTVAANANPARASHPLGYNGARQQHESAGARGRQEARATSPYDRPRRFTRRTMSAPSILSRKRRHLEGVRTPMATCSSAKVTRLSTAPSSYCPWSSLAPRKCWRSSMAPAARSSTAPRTVSRLIAAPNFRWSSAAPPTLSADFEHTGHTPAGG